MSGMEKQELHDRIKAMTPDEFKVTVECIPSEYLWDELVRRDIKKNADDIRCEKGNEGQW